MQNVQTILFFFTLLLFGQSKHSTWQVKKWERKKKFINCLSSYRWWSRNSIDHLFCCQFLLATWKTKKIANEKRRITYSHSEVITSFDWITRPQLDVHSFNIIFNQTESANNLMVWKEGRICGYQRQTSSQNKTSYVTYT